MSKFSTGIQADSLMHRIMSAKYFITAEEEYKKDVMLKKEDVIKIRDWLRIQPDLPHNLSETKLLAYIHCCDYDLDSAKLVLQRDCALRKKHPKLLAELDPCTPEQENIWKLAEFWTSRGTTPEGYRVCYAGLHNPDARNYDFLEAMKAAIMVLRADQAERGTCPGFVFVLNAKGTSFGHMIKASLGTVRTFLTYVQEANPIKMKAVHVINISYIVDKLMMLTRPFINKQLYDIIQLHSGDMTGFFNALTDNVLPSELGGTAGSLEELRNEAKLKNEIFRDYFLEERELYLPKTKPE